MEEIKFELLHGEAAYLVWYVFNDCQIRIETLMDIDKNLELIVSEDVLAFRYDHPDEMRDMVKDDGKWRTTKEGDELDSKDKNKLKLLCWDYTFN